MRLVRLHFLSFALKKSIRKFLSGIPRLKRGADIDSHNKPGCEHIDSWDQVAQALSMASMSADWAILLDCEGKSLTGFSISKGPVPDNFDTASQQSFTELMNVQDRVKYLNAISLSKETGGSSVEQVRLSLPMGPWVDRGFVEFDLNLKLVTIGDELTSEQFIILVGRDVSAQTEEFRALRKRVDDREKSEIAKSRFLANMSHELRTPLNAIVGFSELLQSDMMARMPEEKRGEYVTIIHDSAHHLLGVINDVLDMSKIEAGKYQIIAEPFFLQNTIDTVISMFTVQAEKKGITVSKRLSDDLPEVSGDSRAIKQVLINLLSNAIKFSKDGGLVTIKAERRGRKVQISICDQGIGLSQTQIEMLGQPFYQADNEFSRKFEGTGLGFSVVMGLVKLHDGTVQIESALDVGTTITVTLPTVSKCSAPVPADNQDVVRVDRMNGHCDPIIIERKQAWAG